MWKDAFPRAGPLVTASLLSTTACAGTGSLPSADASGAATIRRIVDEAFEAETRRALEAIPSVHTEDAVVQPADAPSFQGRQALRHFHTEFYELPFEAVRGGSQEEDIGSSNDLAWDRGSAHSGALRPDRSTSSAPGTSLRHASYHAGGMSPAIFHRSSPHIRLSDTRRPG